MGLLLRVTNALLLALMLASCLAQDDASGAPTIEAKAIANSAVQTISQGADATTADVFKSIKESTDGIQLAIQAGMNKDTSKMLKGIGDAVGVLPGAFGVAGIAFSVAASVVALVGGGPSHEDPVLVALHDLHASFTTEMDAIQTTLAAVNDQVGVVLTGIDRLLHEISDLPAKVVAEMKLTDVTTMKDKFTAVHSASRQYASGNLTRDQMAAKCDDFGIAALFSELGTIVRDEKGLLATAFGAHDHAYGLVQARLLAFYLSVVPLVTNCNSLKYSLTSLEADGREMRELVQTVYNCLVWYLTAPDKTISVRESFTPFVTMIDVDASPKLDGWTSTLSFKAYSFAPPHAACFEVIAGGKGLNARTLSPRAKVPNANTFCTKNLPTDYTSVRLVYAERFAGDGTGVTIVQPEIGSDFDGLDVRGWTRDVLVMYADARTSHWTRLPRLRLISDVVLLQAESTKVSVDDISRQCQALGDGYDRSGDAHSKDYSSAPWTILCVQSTTLSLREVDRTTNVFLTDVQFIDMETKAARTATCPSGYVRDTGHVTLPSKIKKQWFGGASTVRTFIVCLKWDRLTSSSAPKDFIDRVWLDDSVPMPDKPKFARHTGDAPMVVV